MAAEIECVRSGGHLASIHSTAQNDAVKTLAGSEPVWLGFHDLHREAGCFDRDREDWTNSDPGHGSNVQLGFIWTDGSEVICRGTWARVTIDQFRH